MPLRYLQLPESQYIPKHTPISENLLGRTSDIIAAQSQAGLQYKMDTLDELNRATRERYGGLSEQDQAYVADELLGVRSRLEETADTQGTRQMQRYVGREAREFQNKMKYHDRAAAEISQIQDAVKASDSPAPSNVVGFLQRQAGKIQYDEETGRASGFETNLNSHHLRVVENWVDIDKFIADFSKKAEFGVTGQSTQQITEDGFKITEGLKAILGEDVMSANINRMMSNSQIRDQLHLMALADKQAFEDSIERRIESGEIDVPENPYVSDSEIKVHFIDENGKDIIQVIPIEEYAAKKAMDKVAPYAQRMHFIDQTFKIDTTSLTRSSADQELNAVGLSGIDVAEITNIPTFMQETYAEKMQLRDQALSVRGAILENLSSFGVSDMSVAENNEVQVLIDNKWNNWSDFVSSLENPGLLNSAQEQIDTYRIIRNQANNIEKKLTSIADGAMEELINHPEFSALADMISISPQGNIVIDSSGDVSSLFDLGFIPEGKPLREFSEDKRVRIDREIPELKEGEIQRIPGSSEPTHVNLMGRGVIQVGDTRDSYIYRRGDEYRIFIEPRNFVFAQAQDFLENTMSTITNEIMETGQREVASHYFDIHDKRDVRIVDLIRRASFDQGTLQTPKGEAFELDTDQTFEPFSFHNKDGEFFVKGYVEDSEKTREKGVFTFSGQLAENLLRTQLGDDFYHYTALNTIKSQIPKMWQSDNNQTTLNKSLLSNIGLINLPDINITFDYRINRQNPNDPKRIRHYRIEGEGFPPIVVNTQEKIYRELLNLSAIRSAK